MLSPVNGVVRIGVAFWKHVGSIKRTTEYIITQLT